MVSLFLYFLLAPVIFAVITYLGVIAYRKYKDAQLNSGDYLSIKNEAEDLIGDEWKAKIHETSERILDETKCNKTPEDKNFLPCHRKWLHDGPCAHKSEPLHEGNEVIVYMDALNKFNAFKDEELAKTGGPLKCSDNKYSGDYDCEEVSRGVAAHNTAHDRLMEWLVGKETRNLTGWQVMDPLATIGRRVEPEAPTVVKSPLVKKEQVVILPNEFVTFMGNNGLSVERIIQLTKQAIAFDQADRAPYAQTIRNNAVKKALDEERAKFIVQLKEIEAKVRAEKEDDAFHLKVVTEEKARLEAENARLQSTAPKTVKKPKRKPTKKSLKKPKKRKVFHSDDDWT